MTSALGGTKKRPTSRLSQFSERQEALKAQSANIDLVSGATDTSECYKTGLRGALDAANM